MGKNTRGRPGCAGRAGSLTLVAVLLVAFPAAGAKSKNYSLDRARAAYEAFEYDQVLPLLVKALARAEGVEQEVEIYAFMAEVHVVLDAPERAAEAFAKVLERDPDYRLPRYTSPKVSAAFDAAKAQSPRGPRRDGGALATMAPSGPPEASGVETADSDDAGDEIELTGVQVHEAAPTWIASPWFWIASAGAAVLVVGVISAVVVGRRPDAPETNWFYPQPR